MTPTYVSGSVRSGFGWFFKYKLYHLPFWFAYHYLWWTLTIGSISQVFNNIFHSALAFKFLFAVVFQAIGVYFNLYFLVPRFLEKGKYIQYICLLLLTIMITASFLVMGYYAAAAWSEKTFEQLFNMRPDNYIYIFKANALSSTVASMTLAMSVKLTKNWIQAREKHHALEKEKLETELKFLRSQFNPHFLFNTINSIFVLINKNPVVASDSLAKFSDLLRYQLYECNEHEIPLRQEVRYLRNFLELERLRQDGDKLELIVEFEDLGTSDLVIAPFVLIPFVENAFKHVSQQKDKRNSIRMNLRLEDMQLQFTIQNSISLKHIHTGDIINYGGIGLKNVQRRLDLIYPQKHRLEIKQDHDCYIVFLQLELHEQKTARHVMAMELD